jgi:SAM-dependent methyltransferase
LSAAFLYPEADFVLLPELIFCPQCGHALEDPGYGTLACRCGACSLRNESGLYLSEGFDSIVDIERLVRDAQADTYLQHAKFPTQLDSFRTWLQSAAGGSDQRYQGGDGNYCALDLGCGPGPYTRELQQAGFKVLAVDASATSLAINADACSHSSNAGNVSFVQYDLNQLVLKPASVDLVLMADFIQHLGGRQQRERLLREVAVAMKPGARFYMSFFNLNLKHYFKGDVHGGFAGGAIRYERLTLPNMLAEMPQALRVEKVQPLNVFHSVVPDRLAAYLPGVFWLARMAAISGRKASDLETS